MHNKVKKLYNLYTAEDLKEQLYNEPFSRTTVSFYHYFPISEPLELRNSMYESLFELKVFGRIYLAHEGINAQISIPSHNFNEFRDYLYSIKDLNGIRLNIAVDDDGKSFWVLKIKVRDKVVADGITDPGFSIENRGRYVNAKEFNELSKDDDVVIIDMRNHYEYEVGHFSNAIEIPSDTFREQLPLAAKMMSEHKDKNIIMYCTGGIRCEKASAYMLHQGFKNVFHLEGGIINYTNQVKEQRLENKFLGKNFVFDNRLGETIGVEIISNCHQCGKPCDTHVNCANSGCHLLFIQCSECCTQYEQCCSDECQDVIHLSDEEQRALRSRIVKGANVFNKSKSRLKPKN